MENASKGLIMAGSILLTIIVIGLLVYFVSQYRQFPQAQTEAERLAQVAKFNQEYESYDKRKMYGTDVATIVNKVINNNKKYADRITGRYEIDEENNHYINVEITLLTAVESYATQYYEVEQPTGALKSYVETQNYYDDIKGKINGKGSEISIQLGVIFPANTTISLIERHNSFMVPNATIEDFFSDAETYRIQLTSGNNKATKFDERNYTEVYSGFTDFKRKFFECVGIEYDETTSMVDCIKFREIPLKEEEA